MNRSSETTLAILAVLGIIGVGALVAHFEPWSLIILGIGCLIGE
jgi:hypothetical protein